MTSSVNNMFQDFHPDIKLTLVEAVFYAAFGYIPDERERMKPWAERYDPIGNSVNVRVYDSYLDIRNPSLKDNVKINEDNSRFLIRSYTADGHVSQVRWKTATEALLEWADLHTEGCPFEEVVKARRRVLDMFNSIKPMKVV